MVFVLDRNGNALMPCKPAKARHLLKAKKAVIVNRTPFVIRLKFDVEGHKDPVYMGIDAGSKYVGISVVCKNRVLFEGVAELRDGVPRLMHTRSARRGDRRNRKRYRKPRFSNRKKSKPKGWLPPSMIQKVDTHDHIVEMLCSILPIFVITVEVSDFDVSKLANPDITGDEYQHGPKQGYLNAREYVLARDGHCCTKCKKGHEKAKLEVHHIVRRASGGTDSPDNLITLCHECHAKVHAGKFKIKIPEHMQLKHANFMNIVRWALGTRLRERYGKEKVQFSYGYMTKCKRIEYGLTKGHNVDARCIAGFPGAIAPDEIYYFKKVRCHNRQIYKDRIYKNGTRALHQSKDVINGFRLWDTVLYEGKECWITGKRAIGYFALKDNMWEKVSDGVSVKKLKLLERRQHIIVMRRPVEAKKNEGA